MRDTLRLFAFDQDVNPSFSSCGTHWIGKEYRDVDVLFSQRILPVLLETKWPRMKKVELRGVKALIVGDCVGRMRNRDEDRDIVEPDEGYSKIVASLRCVFPDDVELIVEEKAGRKYEELRYRDEGLPSMGL